MEKFLGILFCGGYGKRLGEISKFISKSFIPIYDRPVFRYGLELLEKSNYVDEIVILTNHINNEKLMDLGYQTIIQDDEFVRDMVSGFFFIRETLKSEKHAVLVPSDNISDVDLDGLIEHFLEKGADISFSLYEVEELEKITEMGCYDPQGGQFYYKNPHPPTRYGVIAPYVVKNGIDEQGEIELLSKESAAYGIHSGFWFDVGDFNSIVEASKFIMRRRSDVKGK